MNSRELRETRSLGETSRKFAQGATNMARKHNFLLGYGQRLTGPVEVPKGGGDKNPPYPFHQAQSRVTKRARVIAKQVGDLPSKACPGDEVVLAVTMHPRYISKSDFPDQLL